MAAITAKLVQDLRTKTGAGMMDCKKALTETNGDFEVAVDWLRKKGLAAAGKKADRSAAEGLVAAKVSGIHGVMVEINSETDFVARNDVFQKLVSDVLEAYEGNPSAELEALKQVKLSSGRTIAEEITHNIATIGENMNLRRIAKISVSQGAVALYIHNNVTDNAGKIAVLVGLESSADAAKLQELGKKVAMHIAATKPEALDVESLSSEVVERERLIFSDQAKASGKPENVIEKMVEGRLRKFYEEVVLLEQKFVMDPDLTVKGLLEQASKDLGAAIKLTSFKCFVLGEGVEVEKKDFAEEVASLSK